MALQCRIEVELLAHHAAIANREFRELLQPLQEALGFDSAVRLDIADHDVVARGLAARAASSMP